MLGQVQYSTTQAADVLTMQNFQINFPQDFGNWQIQRKSSLRNSTVTSRGFALSVTRDRE